VVLSTPAKTLEEELKSTGTGFSAMIEVSPLQPIKATP
jgi:hypothetical protein